MKVDERRIMIVMLILSKHTHYLSGFSAGRILYQDIGPTEIEP